MSEYLPAVIIPAHNEELSIATLLRALMPGVQKELYTITVACNGCSDRTAEIVRYHFPQVCCIEQEQASKVAALNAAENADLGFPRVYIDADVVISSSAVETLIDTCRESREPTVVAPRAVPKNEGCEWLVRTYYLAWQKTIFFQQHGFGSGVYALNRPAREKFERFPNLISDDGFVRQILNYDNIRVVESAKSLVKSPRDLAGLIRIKTRSKLGSLEISNSEVKMGSGPQVNQRFLQRPTILERLVYGGVNLLALLNARRLIRKRGRAYWLRDETSRHSA
ncbi:glycosyltransferase [Microbulbifer guangxiensis]|uniref:glycosyltransferase n=1 Tax=Microbulbifer guangxiensis TaxID=2904249 RepID=UPI001F3C9B87|nr:glycosyltransferase [Microbulbifer guangxiensis]